MMKEKFLKQFNNLKFRDNIFDDKDSLILTPLDILFELKQEIELKLDSIYFNHNLFFNEMNQKILGKYNEIILIKDNLTKEFKFKSLLEEKKQIDKIKAEELIVVNLKKINSLNISEANRFFKNITKENNLKMSQKIDEITNLKNINNYDLNLKIINFSKEKINILENFQKKAKEEIDEINQKIHKIDEEMKSKKELFNNENLRLSTSHNQFVLEQKNEYIRQNIRINNLINEIKHSSNVEWENLEKAHIVEADSLAKVFEKEKIRFEQTISMIKKKYANRINQEQLNFEKEDELLRQKLLEIYHEINLFAKNEKLKNFNVMNKESIDELKKRLNDKSFKKFLKLKGEILEYEAISNKNQLIYKNKRYLLSMQDKLFQELEKIDHDHNIFALNQRKYLENETYELDDENENLNLRRKLIKTEIQLNMINNLYNRQLAISNLNYENKNFKNEISMNLIEKSSFLEKLPLKQKLDELDILFDYDAQKTNLKYQNIIQKIRLNREKILQEAQKKIDYQKELLNENNNYYYFLLQRKIEIEKANIDLYNTNFAIFKLETMKNANIKKINNEVELETLYLDKLIELSNLYDEKINHAFDVVFSSNEKIESSFMLISNKIIQNDNYFLSNMINLIYQYQSDEILKEISTLSNLFLTSSKNITVLMYRKKLFFKNDHLNEELTSYFDFLDDLYDKFILKSNLKINEMLLMKNDINSKIKNLQDKITRDNYLLNQLQKNFENNRSSRKQKELMLLDIKKSQVLFNHYYKFNFSLKKNLANINKHLKLLMVNREKVAIFQNKLKATKNFISKELKFGKYKIYKKVIAVINNYYHNLSAEFMNLNFSHEKNESKESLLENIKKLRDDYGEKVINIKNKFIEENLKQFYKFQDCQKYLIEFKNEMILMLFELTNNLTQEYENYKISQLNFFIDLEKIESNLLKDKIEQINAHDQEELLIWNENIKMLDNKFIQGLKFIDYNYNYELKLIDENFSTSLSNLNNITKKKNNNLNYNCKKLKINTGKQLRKIQKELTFFSLNNKFKKLGIIKKFDDLKKESLNNILLKEKKILQKITLNKRKIDFLHLEYNKIVQQNKKRANLAAKNLKFEFRLNIKKSEKLLNKKIREIKKNKNELI